MIAQIASYVPAEVRAQLVRLPYDLAKYFNLAEDTSILPLARLRVARIRPEGVLRANRLMLDALEGRGPKREPISVMKEEEENYVILDGNSTYVNAWLSDWPDIAVQPPAMRPTGRVNNWECV